VIATTTLPAVVQPIVYVLALSIYSHPDLDQVIQSKTNSFEVLGVLVFRAK
jgi:hypothetical protein